MFRKKSAIGNYEIKPRGRKKSRFRENLEAIIIAVIIALIIRAFVIQAFKIPSGSMETTLLIGDHLLVNKFIYGIKIPFTDTKLIKFKDPKIDDIIVFKFPVDESVDFIKRVVALPGDTVEMRDKQLYVNGQPITKTFTRNSDPNIDANSPRDNMAPRVVPPNTVFVMGDNRDESADSRFWGFVEISKIKGKALIIYWSWDSEEHFPRFGRIGKILR